MTNKKSKIKVRPKSYIRCLLRFKTAIAVVITTQAKCRCAFFAQPKGSPDGKNPSQTVCRFLKVKLATNFYF